MSVAELNEFLKATVNLEFKARNKQEKYNWLTKELAAYQYWQRPKKEKGIILKYLRKMTGYSDIQTKRLVAAWHKHGRLKVNNYNRHTFPKIYTQGDISLLAATDEAHLVPCGGAARKIMEREYTLFSKPEYIRLAHISVSHLYNLRNSFNYRQKVLTFTKTKPTQVRLGERKKPAPEGLPGYIRIDTVHQGDGCNGEKGVYYIHAVDEVTQWEMVVPVTTISERHMYPALKIILAAFPFVILNFHTDNGGEFINKVVVKLLNGLMIKLSKSRPRRHNDNALIEGKNGSVVRKHFGYSYIPGTVAPIINSWCQDYLNPYLNFHHPCAYPTVKRDAKGKERIIYPSEDYTTPYEKLKAVPNINNYLKKGVTFDQLDKIAYVQSDTEFAQEMQQAKQTLYLNIKNQINQITELTRNN